MFLLYEIERDVRIDPRNLKSERTQAIREELNSLYSNRVLLNVGLCMTLWDIKSIGPALIYPGDGGVHSKVIFRYIIFRPFQDEILLGKIKNSTPEGVYVTLGFFDDILIPPEGLQYPSRFDEREQVWIWNYQTEDEETHEMYMDKGETLRFRIVAEGFSDTTPIPSGVGTSGTGAGHSVQTPTSGGGPTTSSGGSGAMMESGSSVEGKSKTPYSLTGSVNEPGLGLLTWWS